MARGDPMDKLPGDLIVLLDDLDILRKGLDLAWEARDEKKAAEILRAIKVLCAKIDRLKDL